MHANTPPSYVIHTYVLYIYKYTRYVHVGVVQRKRERKRYGRKEARVCALPLYETAKLTRQQLSFRPYRSKRGRSLLVDEMAQRRAVREISQKKSRIHSLRRGLLLTVPPVNRIQCVPRRYMGLGFGLKEESLSCLLAGDEDEGEGPADIIVNVRTTSTNHSKRREENKRGRSTYRCSLYDTPPCLLLTVNRLF